MLVSYISIVSETCRGAESCYGDGGGGFELNSHVITVACLSMSIGGSVLDENSDNERERDCSVVILSCSPFASRAPT